MSGGDFWTRRRAAVEAEAEAEEAQLVEQEREETQAALEEQTDEEICAALDLPDPDTLQPGDDYSVFLQQAVPERLRRRALRMLWRSNPVLANVDGLVDYGEDFTDAATVIENLSTTYQVGKGMLEHVMRSQQPEEMAEARPESEEAELEAAEEPAEPPEEIQAELDPIPHDDEPLPRRRMRFEFTEEASAANS